MGFRNLSIVPPQHIAQRHILHVKKAAPDRAGLTLRVYKPDVPASQFKVAGAAVGFGAYEQDFLTGVQLLCQQAVPHPSNDLAPVQKLFRAAKTGGVHLHDGQCFFIHWLDLLIRDAHVEKVAAVVPKVMGDPLVSLHME